MKKQIRAGVVLVNYHTSENIIRIAKIFESYDIVDYIVIVNNDTTDAEKEELRPLRGGKIRVLFEKENLGYSKGNNKGIRFLMKAQRIPDYLIISNSDIKVEEQAIASVIEKLEARPEYGAMAPRMLDHKGVPCDLRVIPLGYKRLFLESFTARLDHKMQGKLQEDKDGIIEQSFLPGSFFICRTEAMEKCGLFDPKIFLYREEEILGERMYREGYLLGIDNRVYYLHNHEYYNVNVCKLIKMHRQSFISERYYFRKYLNANVVQLLFVSICEELIMLKHLVRLVLYRLKEGNKSCLKTQ